MRAALLASLALLGAACGRAPIKDLSRFGGADSGVGAPEASFVGLDGALPPDDATAPVRDGGVGADRPVGADRLVGADRPSPDAAPECPADCERTGDPCTRGVCNRARGVCEIVQAPEGTPCTDEDECTVGDSCRRGRCLPMGPRECGVTGSSCVHGGCDPSIGCFRELAPDGVPCEDGNACTTGDHCLGGMCVAQMGGGACLGATPVPLVVGGSRAVSGPGCFSDEVQGSCAPSGPDVVFVLQNDGPRHVRATEASRAHALVVQSECGNRATELACGFPSPDSGDLLLERGPVYFAVDQLMSPNMQTVLSVEVDPHDACARAIDLPLPPPGGVVEVRGTTVGARDDVQGPCAGNLASPDHFYRLSVMVPTAVELRMLPPRSGQTFDAAMMLLAGGCASGMTMPIACDDDGAGNFQPLISAVLQPGVYVVVVDGFGQGNAGEYALQLTQRTQTAGLVFPELGDARLEQQPGGFTAAGDFVEGARRPPLMSVGSASIDLSLDNRLMCDALELRAMINGTTIGRFVVGPGQRRVQQTLSFPPIVGPTFNLRYEITRDLMRGCGFVALPNGISTMTLSP